MREFDACGIGFVADVQGRASREIVARALHGLACVKHRGAAAAVQAAMDAGASAGEVAALQATADQLKGQRDTLFKGETLRGLLLSSFAWATIGRIAGIAAWVVLAGAVVMAGLTGAGLFHLRRTTH